MNTLQELMTSWGLTGDSAEWGAVAAGAVGMVLAALVANFVAKKIIVRAVTALVRRTATDWDNILLEEKVFSRLSHLAPAAVFWILAPVVFAAVPDAGFAIRRAAELYMLFAGLAAFYAFFTAIDRIYNTLGVARRVPITGYIQIAKLLLTLAFGILALSIVIDKSPWIFLSGLGAVTAILLLVFKDTILGFVGGIQLAANDMVRPGDWIEMPKFGADGEVMEVALTTVKVRNWDKTITTLPTYTLISDAFKNWRGMSDSGGRRIKRAILLDVNSIRFCTPEMIERLRKIQILRDYIDAKQKELAEHNAKHDIDESVLVNGRRMTNVGTLRAYLVEYLKRHPKIHQDMTFLVRQLPPSEKGLPLEIYVFSNDQAWANYEAIQADIFDHVYAALPEFGLRPYQYPSGADFTGPPAGASPAPAT